MRAAKTGRLRQGAFFVVAFSIVAAGCGGRNAPEPGTSSADERARNNDSTGDDSSTDADSHKVTLCHIPPGNPANAHTITVGEPAVRAHLAHGDYLGPCHGSTEVGAPGTDSIQ